MGSALPLPQADVDNSLLLRLAESYSADPLQLPTVTIDDLLGLKIDNRPGWLGTSSVGGDQIGDIVYWISATSYVCRTECPWAYNSSALFPTKLNVLCRSFLQSWPLVRKVRRRIAPDFR
jgi:hypothetical protein